MRKILSISSILLFSASFLLAQNVNTGGKENLIFKGFISTTLFGQDQSFGFGNGQDAEWVTSNNTQNKWFYGGDIRNTRITMVFNGPELKNDWALGGVLEFDAFNDYANEGAFGQQVPTPRVRLGYVDIKHKNLIVRIGQAWDPLFGNVPVSLSHIAFPLGYGAAGDVGWRFPGIFFYYKFESQSSTHIGLDFAVMENSWANAGGNTNFTTPGNAGSPQFELRLNLESKLSGGGVFKAYVAGHYDQKKLGGIGANTTTNLTGTAEELGLSFSSHGFLIHGNLYSGKNVGQQFGQLTQFSEANHDLASTGFWAQIGYAFESGWGIYGFYGMENVNKDDAVALQMPREKNALYDIMVKYGTGPLELGVEYLHDNLTNLIYGEAGAASEGTLKGTQIALSMLYKF